MKLLPQNALQLAEELMEEGKKKHKPDEWKYISPEEHVSHALTHIGRYLEGDRSERHLVNASCRMLMAAETYHNQDIVWKGKK